jgi:hypothetical protein
MPAIRSARIVWDLEEGTVIGVSARRGTEVTTTVSPGASAASLPGFPEEVPGFAFWTGLWFAPWTGPDALVCESFRVLIGSSSQSDHSSRRNSF